MLELGCGTGNFLQSILTNFPKARCVVFDYSTDMLEYAAQKVARYSDRAEFHQRDLHDGIPPRFGQFHLVSSFSTIHHLFDDNKTRLFKEIYDVLQSDGWFFLIDPMSTRFDNDVFKHFRHRQHHRLDVRFKRAGVDIRDAERINTMVSQVSDDSPEKDRIADFAAHMEWLNEAGFRSVDHIWHLFMEHFIISRK
ncbi:MAG: class I SAM-dependent methyltransferase [Candidatus Poribacteria bacterium]|nr:class I SAM-dependent methyltransferase [Candidatus Poribacteria bacterium]